MLKNAVETVQTLQDFLSSNTDLLLHCQVIQQLFSLSNTPACKNERNIIVIDPRCFSVSNAGKVRTNNQEFCKESALKLGALIYTEKLKSWELDAEQRQAADSEDVLERIQNLFSALNELEKYIATFIDEETEALALEGITMRYTKMLYQEENEKAIEKLQKDSTLEINSFLNRYTRFPEAQYQLTEKALQGIIQRLKTLDEKVRCLKKSQSQSQSFHGPILLPIKRTKPIESKKEPVEALEDGIRFKVLSQLLEQVKEQKPNKRRSLSASKRLSLSLFQRNKTASTSDAEKLITFFDNLLEEYKPLLTNSDPLIPTKVIVDYFSDRTAKYAKYFHKIRVNSKNGVLLSDKDKNTQSQEDKHIFDFVYTLAKTVGSLEANTVPASRNGIKRTSSVAVLPAKSIVEARQRTQSAIFGQ